MNGIIGRYEKTQNLFNYDDSESGYLSNTGTIAPAQDSIRTTFFISVLPNTTYSLKSTGSSRIKAFNQNKEVLSVSTHNDYDISSNENSTFTTNSSTFYIKFSFQPANLPIMFNKGATLLPYEPYGNTWNDIPYSKLETATDVVTSLPVTVYGDGETNISLLLKGNTETSGNPSPQNPVTVDGVGEETANLFNIDTSVIGKYINASGVEVISSSGNYNHSDYINVDSGISYTLSSNKPYYRESTYAIAWYDSNKDFIIRDSWANIPDVAGRYDFTATAPNNAAYAIINFMLYPDFNNEQILFNKGSTALPFEPHGYKILILKDSQPLTSIYLNEPMYILSGNSGTYYDSIVKGQSSFEIKRIGIAEFDGSEGWNYDSTYERFTLDLPDCYNMGLRIVPLKCTHFVDISDGRAIGDVPYNSVYLTSSATTTVLNVKTNDFLTVPDFTTWLGQQKTAGTPVKLYYVLKSTQNIPLDLPTIETTGGTATIDVGTTVKPSELDLTYHGWHEHQPLKRENGQWV